MLKEKTAEYWLARRTQEAQVDPHLWQHHNKLYDLSSYMKSHPGGEQWLTITKGQDVTDYVETYHINIDQVNQVIKKYYVKDAAKPRKYFFEYDENSLFVTLRKKAYKMFPNRISRKSTTAMNSIAYGVVLFCLLSFLFFCKFLNIWTCLIYSYSLTLMMGVGHNYSHQNSMFKHAFNPTWIPYKDWMISHALSHHTYPNTRQDLEITLFYPFIYILNCDPSNRPLLRVTQFIIFFLTPLQRILSFLLNPQQIIMKPEVLIFLVQPIAISIIGGHSILSCILYWYLAQGINAILFIFSTFPIHRNIDNWTQGMTANSKDLGVHMLRTTMEHDLGLSTITSFLIYLGFTDHVLHHMFPAIDKSKLVQLNPIFLQTCKQMNLMKELKVSSFEKIVGGYMKRLTPK